MAGIETSAYRKRSGVAAMMVAAANIMAAKQQQKPQQTSTWQQHRHGRKHRIEIVS